MINFERQLIFFNAKTDYDIMSANVFDIQLNSVITNSVVNEHSVITNKFYRRITSHINPVITNPGYNGRKWPVPNCSL